MYKTLSSNGLFFWNLLKNQLFMLVHCSTPFLQIERDTHLHEWRYTNCTCKRTTEEWCRWKWSWDQLRQGCNLSCKQPQKSTGRLALEKTQRLISNIFDYVFNCKKVLDIKSQGKQSGWWFRTVANHISLSALVSTKASFLLTFVKSVSRICFYSVTFTCNGEYDKNKSHNNVLRWRVRVSEPSKTVREEEFCGSKSKREETEENSSKL